jgi:hypothetical protein
VLSLLGFVVPWWGRWLAIAGILAAAAAWGAAKMHAHDEREFDAYREEVKLAGDRQNELTRQVTTAQAQLKEISDAEWKTKHDAAVGALAAAQLRLDQARRDRRLVPAAPAGAGSGDRLCLSRDELDRGLREAIGRLQQRALAVAAEGQRGIDIASTCSSWARGLQGPHSGGGR